MKYLATVVIMVLALLLTAQVWAGGARVAGRPGKVAGGGAANAVSSSWRSGRGPTQFRYYHYPYGYRYGYFDSPVIVVLPHYYPYFLPTTVVVNAPFFCLLHQAGYVSRVGMIEHLSGTHKFPIDAAAFICPEGVESCVFPAY